MGTKRFDYLNDLSRHGAMLSGKCMDCGHRGDISPYALMMRGEEHNTPLEYLARRLRCSVCGSRRK